MQRRLGLFLWKLKKKRGEVSIVFSRENETLESFLLTKGAKIKEKKKQRYREREEEREREREVDEACP